MNETLVLIFFLLAVILNKNQGYKTSEFLSILQGAVVCSQTIVVVMFWTILAPGMLFGRKKTIATYYYHIYRHVFPFVFTLADFLNNREKFQKKKSLYLVLTYTGAYGIFLFFYIKITGKVVYKTSLMDFSSNLIFFNIFFRLDDLCLRGSTWIFALFTHQFI